MLSIIPSVKGKILVVTGNLFQATINVTTGLNVTKREYIGGSRSLLVSGHTSDGREITTKPCWIL